jgi:leader peptidase (prepilin peptidase)/N-methyltransferase
MLEGGFWLCHEEMSFEEMLYRKSDTIHLFARRVLTPHGAWTDVPVRLSPERLQIGETTFNPEAVERMEVVTEKITVPREAMGLGDVKFMAAIGAFLGWPAVIFALAASSLFGSIVGVTLIALGIRDRSARLQYGPFIALAAVLWVFLPSEWQQKWLWQLQLLGRFLFRTPAPELP